MKRKIDLRAGVLRGGALVAIAGALAVQGCAASTGFTLANAQALMQLSKEPLPSEPWVFDGQPGTLVKTEHFRIFTTIDDGLYKRLLARTLEATHDRMAAWNPSVSVPPADQRLDCYVFSSRLQWEAYTRLRGGSNAPIYLQITAGGYCQEGVFAGYNIGQEQTLSVVAHEAWHQYSWFAFKNRLPGWLEEGLATQNESMDWETGPDGNIRPVFHPEQNYRRFSALQRAFKNDQLIKVPALFSMHAGQVIGANQGRIDTYYAQLWSMVLFLQRSPAYAPRLKRLLADASAGKLTAALEGTSVTRGQIENFTEHWNTVAGPVYAQKYLNGDLGSLEREYLSVLTEFTRSWPPK
jgi:hypothetical protein